MKRNALLSVLIMWVFSGCALMNISLVPATKPLEETVLEGDGTPKILLVDLDGLISFREETDGLKLKQRKPGADIRINSYTRVTSKS